MVQLMVGTNDLLTLRSDLAKQLVNPELAKTVTVGSGVSLDWFCNGTDLSPHPRFEWACWVAHRADGRGCPACAGKAVIVGWNDLGTKCPDLAEQLDDPKDAHRYTSGSKAEPVWRCSGVAGRAHPTFRWAAQIANRVSGKGCPACAGRSVIVGWNDLATTHPELAAQLVNPLDGHHLTAGSNTKAEWQCLGTMDSPHPCWSWEAKVCNRVNGRGCSVCSGKAVLVGWNDLATTHPELAAQLVNPLDGHHLTAGSNDKVDWHCSGTVESPHPYWAWNAMVCNRAYGRGCGICSGKSVLAGWNDLATTCPDLAVQLTTPEVARCISEGSGQMVEWWCEGVASRAHPRYRWTALPSSRTRSNRPSGCPACVGKAIIVGWNDLATTHEALVRYLTDSTLATKYTFGSNVKVEWWCDGTPLSRHEHFRWTTTIASRAAGSGCPRCKKGSYDPSGEGWVYRGEFCHGGVAAIFFGKSTSVDLRARHYLGALSDVAELVAFRVGTGRHATAHEILLNRLMREWSVPSCHTFGLGVNGLSESFYPARCTSGFLDAFESTFADIVAVSTERRDFVAPRVSGV